MIDKELKEEAIEKFEVLLGGVESGQLPPHYAEAFDLGVDREGEDQSVLVIIGRTHALMELLREVSRQKGPIDPR